MFFNTHVFVVSSKYTQKNNTNLIIGSILPDVAITKIIGWEKTFHDISSVENFSSLLLKTNPELYPDIYNGLLSHVQLDKLSHDKYLGDKGYAYQNTNDLIDLVSKYYKTKYDKAKKIGHNYIESAVDLVLLREYPETQGYLRNAVKKTKVENLANILAIYFGADQRLFQEKLIVYFNLITKHDLSYIESWIDLWDELGHLMGLVSVRSAYKEKLIQTSLKIVADTYKEFLRNSILKT